MAKKKKSINLVKDNILFELEERICKVICFYPHNMTVEIICSYNDKKEQRNIPFAHLPKKIKKYIKPN